MYIESSSAIYFLSMNDEIRAVQTARNLCQGFQLFTLSLSCENFKLVWLYVCLHRKVIASFCIVEDQFAVLAVNQPIEFLSLKSINLTSFAKKFLLVYPLEINWNDQTRCFQILGIARPLIRFARLTATEKVWSI